MSLSYFNCQHILEVCRQLAQQGYQVVLTSRDEAKGKAAAATIRQTGANIVYYPLDVASQTSVHKLQSFVRNELGHVDALINNAAVYLDEGHNVLDVEMGVFRTTIETNTYGPLMLCQAIVPLMLKQGHGRVVNVSSGSGQLASMSGDTPAYCLSKIALNALTMMVANTVKGKNVLVNAVCPGWVRTDMSPNGTRSVEEGADTIVWLATLPDGGPNGGFFRDRKPIPW